MVLDKLVQGNAFRAFALSSALVAGLSGCAPKEPPIADQERLLNAVQSANADDSIAREMFRIGLKGISQRYIDPREIDDLTLSGLRGLAAIDPALQIEFDQGQAHLLAAGEEVAAFPLPTIDNPALWANLTLKMVHAARAHSEDLSAADDEKLFAAVYDGMLSDLDPFSRYDGRDQAQANRAKREGFGGIGIRFTKAEDGILVTHVMEDAPARDAGLRPGDLIINVGGTDVTQMTKRKVAALLRGTMGSRVLVRVERLSSGPEGELQKGRRIDFNLTRAHIVPDTVIASVQDDIVFMRVRSFNRKTADSMDKILRAQQATIASGKIKGVVVDLRGNPGGLMSQSVRVADLFLDSGRIIATRGRHRDSVSDYQADEVDLAHGLPLVVLVDGNSASAAEIVASALQDLGRAVVVGSTSYGKGTVQTVIHLPNDGELTLTWSRLVSPSGYALHGLGVIPAVCATHDGVQALDTILAPAHIDGQRDTMTAWRAAGQIFDGRRKGLRHACPAKVFKSGENGDLLIQLARQVIADPALYQRAVQVAQPIATAHRN